jgi:hypothetical protein
VSRSLAEFGTVAFDLDLMYRLIKWGEGEKCPCCGRGEPRSNLGGVLELGFWYDLVPMAYREDVSRIVQEISGDFLGRKADAEALDRFVSVLHQRIFSEMQWREPT